MTTLNTNDILVYFNDKLVSDDHHVVIEYTELHRNDECSQSMQQQQPGCPLAYHMDLHRQTSSDIIKLIERGYEKWVNVVKVVFTKDNDGVMYIGYDVNDNGVTGGLIGTYMIVNICIRPKHVSNYLNDFERETLR